MKAIIYEKYGSTDYLELKEVDSPRPQPHEVLIRVKASSVNSWDWDLVRGRPYIVRMDGLFKPKHRILGADIAGIVEAVGEKATRFQVGDAVFGDLSGGDWGGFGEMVCADEKVLAIKPSSMSFEDAAAIPQAGVLALQGIRNKGEIRPGQRVLINGAGGGVGTFAIQLLKNLDTEVTAVDRREKLDFMRAVGADHVIDYTKENFTDNGQRYDLILDMMAYRSNADYRNSLTPEGRLVVIGGKMGRIFSILISQLFRSKNSGPKLTILAHKPNAEDLDILAGLYTAGKLKPVIEHCYPLEETAQAVRHLGEGHAKGKLVIIPQA